MEQQKAVRPEALEAMHEAIKADYHRLMVAYNTSWHTPQEREEARQALAKAVKNAKHAVQELEGTLDAELRHWHDQLVIQVTLSEGAVRDPNTLKR